MQVSSMSRRMFAFVGFCLFYFTSMCQVNAVEFGKNRIQHKKFIWKFYQSPNFNTYFNQGGLELAKYVVQVAEQDGRQAGGERGHRDVDAEEGGVVPRPALQLLGGRTVEGGGQVGHGWLQGRPLPVGTG